MKDIILSVPEKEYSFFIKVIKQFDFVQIKEKKKKQTAKQEFLDGLKEAVDQVNLAKAGKIKLKSAEELLNDISKEDALPIVFAKNPDVTALAGIWKGKDISLSGLRQK